MCFWLCNIPGLQCYECIGPQDDMPNDCPQKECNNGVCVKGEWENFLSLIQNKSKLSLGKYLQNHVRPNRFFSLFHTNKQEKWLSVIRAHSIVKKENSLFPFRLKNGHTYRICYENHQQEGGCLEVSTNTILPLSKNREFFFLSILGIFMQTTLP